MEQWLQGLWGSRLCSFKSAEAGVSRKQSQWREDVVRWARSLGLCKPGYGVWSLFYQCWEATGECWTRKYHLSSVSKTSHWLMNVWDGELLEEMQWKQQLGSCLLSAWSPVYPETAVGANHRSGSRPRVYKASSGLIAPSDGRHGNCIASDNTQIPENPPKSSQLLSL